jgi:hypothetical protein
VRRTNRAMLIVTIVVIVALVIGPVLVLLATIKL